MTSIKVFAEGSTISATLDGKLTSGMVGVPVEIEYNQDWENLSKICIFRVGSFSRQRERVDKTTTVPWEVLRNFGKSLEVGIQGKTEDGEIVIPTVWATVGLIHEGANATIPGAPAPSPGETPSGSDLIDDGVISSQRTWSSSKTNLEIDRKIRSWINDDDVDAETLWSSAKISEAISEAAGGSAGKQYELIETITLTEAVTGFKRTADTNGVPYNFSAIRVFMNTPANSDLTGSGSVIFSTKKGDTYVSYTWATSLSKSAETQTAFLSRNDHGMLEDAVWTVSYNDTATSRMRPPYIVTLWKNIDYLAISPQNSQVLPSGTQIKIYAIRG